MRDRCPNAAIGVQPRFVPRPFDLRRLTSDTSPKTTDVGNKKSNPIIVHLSPTGLRSNANIINLNDFGHSFLS